MYACCMLLHATNNDSIQRARGDYKDATDRRLVVCLTLRGRSSCMDRSQGVLKGYSRGTQGVLKGYSRIIKGYSRAACSLCAAGPAAGTEARPLLPRVRTHTALLAEGAAQSRACKASHAKCNAWNPPNLATPNRAAIQTSRYVACWMRRRVCCMPHAPRCSLQDALYLMLNQSQPHRFCLGAAASVYKFRKMLFAMTMARTLCCAAPPLPLREPPRGDSGARCCDRRARCACMGPQ